MDEFRHHDFKRILIIKPSSFGDVIHALPVLVGLRRRYPRAHISWLVSTACAGLLEGHPSLDEIIPFDRKYYGRLGRSWRATVDFARFCRELRRRRFDLVVDLQGLFRSGFLSLISGAYTRVGFANARECAPLFYSQRIVIPEDCTHAVDRNYLFGKALGFAGVPVTFDLPVAAEAEAAMARRLADAGVDRDRGYALIAPGTRWETKHWPLASFVEVARQVRERYGLSIVVTGAPDEAEIGGQLAEAVGEPVVNLAGETTLGELIALVAGARVAVMHDSGPMHLATALGRPMVAIYGPTSPDRTGPYDRQEAIARLALDCSPCYLKRLAQCGYDHRCMRDLSPAMILDRVDRLLA